MKRALYLADFDQFQVNFRMAPSQWSGCQESRTVPDLHWCHGIPRSSCGIAVWRFGQSATVLAIARNEGYDVHALVVDYGQRHRHELEAAKNLAQAAGVPFRVMPLDLRVFGGSALTDDIDVPHGRDESEMQEDIPVTYVPARNLIFLSLALGFAETIGAKDLFLGVNAVDYSRGIPIVDLSF